MMYLSQSKPRQQESFGFDWFFHLGDLSPEVAHSSDQDWRPVSLPHDWSVEYAYDQHAPSGGTGGYVVTGIGWYRKRFTIDPKTQGKHISLLFDGVHMNCQVWLNGQHLGGHISGYTPFECDITAVVNYDGENIIMVQVDNSVQPNSRWYTGSGVTRDVWIRALDPIHVATYGSYITMIEVSDMGASICVQTRIENPGSARSVVLSTTISDAAHRPVTSYAGDKAFALTTGTTECTQNLAIASPKRWSVDTPYLYRAVTRVLVDGRVADEYATPFGIRTIAFDKDQGFLLNGERVKINGVCVHHDGGCVGAAVPQKLWERRLKKLKEMGCNGIRCAHNPPDTALLDLCDQLGFLVMDEAFDEWAIIKNTKAGRDKDVISRGYGEWFDQCHVADLEAMLYRDRNHPSIVLWSIGNEVPEQMEEDGYLLARELTQICHRIDSSRPVVLACDFIAAEPRAARPEFLNELDVVGYNYVDRWRTRAETFYEDDRRNHPEWCIIGSENGGVRGSVRGQYLFAVPEGAPYRSTPYFSMPVNGAKLLRFTMTRDYVAGDFMWTGIDHLGEAHWPAKASSAGVLDLCGFPKDSFYFYKSVWNRSLPTVHIFPHWNLDIAEGTIIPVLCYTSCEYTELFLNGISYGKKAYIFPRSGATANISAFDMRLPYANTDDLFLSWDVPYMPGMIAAVGYQNGVEVARTIVCTAGAPVRIEALADCAELVADGRDICQIDIRILDAQGQLVPNARHTLHVVVSGAGRLIGLDNGDPESKELYTSADRMAFGGMAFAIVQSARVSGEITITITAEGLEHAVLMVKGQ
jgi:beta-galactosidase